jgi:pimeloyl-ACP methyl ester carboxylesterase
MADSPRSDSRSLGKRLLHWSVGAALSLLALIIVLACVGATYQVIGNWRDARRFPRRGKSVQAGEVKLNLNCSGAGSPAVILESGGGMSSIGWIKIQPEIAKYARVCSYDRAGYGWSESGPEPRTSLQIAKELKLLLDTAGEKGPYVMAGASLGGIYVRVYMGLYPADVAGVVLVDASHEDQLDRFANYLPAALKDRNRREQERAERLGEILTPLMIHLGIQRFQTAAGWDTPPFHLAKEFWQESLYLDQQMKSRKVFASEMKALPQTNAQARSAGNLGDRPLIVLTRGKMGFATDELVTKELVDQLTNLWIHDLQGEQARLSTRGKQIIVPDSGHVIQFERPDAVISAIHEVWSAATAAH